MHKTQTAIKLLLVLTSFALLSALSGAVSGAATTNVPTSSPPRTITYHFIEHAAIGGSQYPGYSIKLVLPKNVKFVTHSPAKIDGADFVLDFPERPTSAAGFLSVDGMNCGFAVANGPTGRKAVLEAASF